MIIFETIIYAILAAFASRTISHMLIYAYSYGQFLSWLKIWVAKQIDPELVNSELQNIHTVSHGQERMPQIYDILCDAKGFWAWVISIMDCVFCTGLWVSIIVALAIFLTFGLHWMIILAVPVLTFFFIEKI